jgi:NAD+ synthase
MLAQEIPKIVDWLRNQVEAAGAKGLVVGISGGIDAAVTAALIKKAYPDNSLGIIIPIKSDPQDLVDARLVVETLKIHAYELDLTPEHQSMMDKSWQELENIFPAEQLHRRNADANLRARLRMSALYAAANALNYMVVGTDNKAEYFTGYFTKYGDGACDLLPIVDFTKSEVRELARLLGIPDRIINKAPSAGLWEGQTDEAEMGTTYTHIDAYLNGNPVPERDQEIIERMHRVSEHKRKLPPGYRR